MHADYSDIIEKIQEAPSWWDENAVPRFCKFTPSKMANIYASEGVLLLISCQFGPLHHFRVALSRPSSNAPDLATEIIKKTISFGDPPRIKECRDGDASSIAIRVIEYWKKMGIEWKRDKKLEVDVVQPGFEAYRTPGPFTAGKRQG